MAGFQDLLDNVARVVGGTQPDATNRPRWFSGDQAGDSSGILALYGPSFKGCYSAPVEAPQDYPVAIVLPGKFEVGGPLNRDTFWQGEELNVDELRLLVAISKVDLETDFTNLEQYRDLVPAAFAGHMTAFSTNNALQIMVSGGQTRQINWAGQKYDGWEFTIRAIRMIPQTYTS